MAIILDLFKIYPIKFMSTLPFLYVDFAGFCASDLLESFDFIFRYLKCDLQEFDLSEIGCKFDVMLIEPPLEAYQRSNGVVYDKYWSWDEVIKLINDDIQSVCPCKDHNVTFFPFSKE